MKQHSVPNFEPNYIYTKLQTGITLSHVELGNPDGIPVVLIHGATDSYISFSQVGTVLKDLGYHVYIPELRGHGNSDKPETDLTVAALAADIYGWMEQLGIKKVHMIGHSLGSFVTQELAILYPDLAVSITLIGSAAQIIENPGLKWMLNGDDEFPGLAGFGKEISEDFIREWTDSDNYDPLFVKKTFAHASALPLHTWLSVFHCIDGIDNTRTLSAIKLPVQIIWGTNDSFFSLRNQTELIECIGSDTILFRKKDGQTHNTHWEKNSGKEVANDTHRFIQMQVAVQN